MKQEWFLKTRESLPSLIMESAVQRYSLRGQAKDLPTLTSPGFVPQQSFPTRPVRHILKVTEFIREEYTGKKRYAIGSSGDQTTLLEFVMYENEKKN